MGFELQNVLSFRRTGYALANTVQTARHMTAKVNPFLGACHAHANGSQVTDNLGFLIVATPEQSQDAALELFLHCPTKGQPHPALAVVA
jgi:hypothetical protein